jgi:drug/metabolite transporter (DMT)-like permease
MTAVIIIWAFSAFRGTIGQTVQASKNKKAILFSLAGAFAGPFLGVWMSLVAVANIKAGIAATLNATTPVLIIPTIIFVYHEKVTWRAVIGAIVAISGVALLFLG